jgi:hypothetical protein
MNVEQSVEWELAGETEVLRGNLLQCHFVHHKSHMTWRGLERRGGKLATNRTDLSFILQPSSSLRGTIPYHNRSSGDRVAAVYPLRNWRNESVAA